MLLPLVLMLAADPLTASRAAVPAETPSARIIDAEATGRAVDLATGAAPGCRNGQLLQAENTAANGQTGARLMTGDLMFRSGDPVRVYQLLERRIGACSLPISYDLTAPDARLPSFPARSQ